MARVSRTKPFRTVSPLGSRRWYDQPSMSTDALIIGGGVIGCSLALKLRISGMKVALLDRGPIGHESSRAAAGMLSPQTEAAGPGPFFDLCMRSRSLYPEFAAQVSDISGVDVEYRDEGTLSVALSPEDVSHFKQCASWQAESGLAVDEIDPETLRRIEPALVSSAIGAFFVPGDHQIENRRLMDGLGTALRCSGVEVMEGEGVESLVVQGESVIGAETAHNRLSAGAVVVAAGCWSDHLLRPLGVKADVVPARGQMLAVRSPEPRLSRVAHSRACYLVPRKDNRVVIGSTVEYVGFEKGTTVAGIRSLLDAAVRLVPALEPCEIVESWSGLRPDTPDHLPVLGRCRAENLFVATGHFRSGILLAPVTAELMSELILNGNEQEIRAFSVERFAEAQADHQPLSL